MPYRWTALSPYGSWSGFSITRSRRFRRLRAIPPIFLLSQLLKEPDNALNPTIEVRDMELFVGSVQVVIGQAEAHHHAGDFEHVLEIGHDGNGAAGADEDRIFFEDFMQRLGRGLNERIVGAHHARRSLAEDLDIGFDSLGRQLLHELGVFL